MRGTETSTRILFPHNFLELRKKEGYKPTEYFYKATRGRTEQDKKDALLHCIQSPSIYGDFIEKHNREIIPSDLPSIFYWDYKITEKAKDEAAQIFRESLDYLNLVSSDGRLQFGGNVTVKPEEDGEEETPNEEEENSKDDADTGKQPPKEDPLRKKRPNYKLADIKVGIERFISLEFPEDLTNAEIDRLIRNLETWKD